MKFHALIKETCIVISLSLSSLYLCHGLAKTFHLEQSIVNFRDIKSIRCDNNTIQQDQIYPTLLADCDSHRHSNR